MSNEIIKPLLKKQELVFANLAKLKQILENLRSMLPKILKYSQTYFDMVPIKLKTFRPTKSFEDIKRMIGEKSLEAKIMATVSKAMAAVDVILLVVDPTKISVALTAVFSVVGLVMQIVQQKKENARLENHLHNVEEAWNTMKVMLDHLEHNSNDLKKNWETLKNTGNEYGEQLGDSYIYLHNLLPDIFLASLPGSSSKWISPTTSVSVTNWDSRYKITPSLNPVKIMEVVHQLEADTNLALEIGTEVAQFIEGLEHRFNMIFSKYLEGTGLNLSVAEKYEIISKVVPAIKENFSLIEILKRSSDLGLHLDRDSLMKVIANLMPNNQCYGIYPLSIVRSGGHHTIFQMNFTKQTLEYIKHKTVDGDYSIEKLTQKLKKRKVFLTKDAILYIIASVHLSRSSYLGESLSGRRLCSLEVEAADRPNNLSNQDGFNTPFHAGYLKNNNK